MKCIILGKRKVNFVNSETGERIISSNVAVKYKSPFNSDSTKYEGEQVAEIRVPDELIDKIHIGEKWDMDFDKKGKLLSMELCK